MKKISIGIDTGGTFTDIVVVKDGLEIIDNFKLLSTPENPSNAIINAMNIVFKKHIKVEDEIIYFGHGSTISTNILIENNGSKSILLTTKGFKDLLEIGRQKRSHLYDLFSEKHHKIIRDKFKIEIILKRIPRLIKEPEGRKMGISAAKLLTEKSIIRIIKLAAGVPQ